jgi:hypothetical protein
VLRVVAENGKVRLFGGGAFEPQAEPGRYAGGGMEFAFERDTVRRQGADGETVSFARKPAWTPTEAELQPLVGAYSSLEAGAVMLVSLRGGNLVVAPADRPSAARVAGPLYKDAFQGGPALIRVVRDAKGKVTALRFTNGRVYALDFRRVE